MLKSLLPECQLGGHAGKLQYYCKRDRGIKRRRVKMDFNLSRHLRVTNYSFKLFLTVVVIISIIAGHKGTG